MAITTLTPGVYIEEISTLPPSVAPVATAIPAFIGYTEKAEKNNDADALLNIPTRITSMLEYEQIFGRPYAEVIDVTVTSIPFVVKFLSLDSGLPAGGDSPSRYKMYYSVSAYFANGGGPCYIVSVGNYTVETSVPGTPLATTTIDKDELLDGLNAVRTIDEVTLLCIPEATFLSAPEHKEVNDTMLTQCNDLQDRFALIDVKSVTGNVATDSSDFRDDAVGANNLKYGAVYYPTIISTTSFSYSDTLVTIDGGTYNNQTLAAVKAAPDLTLYNQVKAALDTQLVVLNPSSTIAGVYASVDRDRGVWKAPANVSIVGSAGLTVTVTADEQEGMNVDAGSGKSINAIRPFTGKGTLVWGARTLAGNDNEWRYVNVRRLFIFAEESIKKASEFVVFEPNDKNTWERVRGLISSFLTNLWRDGALVGPTPAQAFFVKVGLGETMTPQDVLEGKLIVEVGMAASRPAEFIILKFSHKLQEA